MIRKGKTEKEKTSKFWDKERSLASRENDKKAPGARLASGLMPKEAWVRSRSKREEGEERETGGSAGALEGG